MTPAARLRAQLDVLLAGIGRGHVPASARADLARHLEATLRVTPSRTAAAVAVIRERSQTIAAGIRLAVGGAPLEHRGLAVFVQKRIARRTPQHFGLERVPCLRVIRRVLVVMQGEQNKCVPYVTSVSPVREKGAYAATVAST